VAPAVAATLTDAFGATFLLFAPGVTVSVPGALDGSVVTATPAFVPPLSPEPWKCAPDDAVQPARSNAPPAISAAAMRRDDVRDRMVI